MEAKDLMIGDWVYILNFPERGKKTPVKIIGMDTNHNAIEYVHNGIRLWSAVVRLEPIQITPEILEKNGFVENRGVTSWKFETKREDLIDIYGVNEYHLSINIEDTHGSGKGYRWMLNNLVIFYVHQLQHALRLCGIKKEITI